MKIQNIFKVREACKSILSILEEEKISEFDINNLLEIFQYDKKYDNERLLKYKMCNTCHKEQPIEKFQLKPFLKSRANFGISETCNDCKERTIIKSSFKAKLIVLAKNKYMRLNHLTDVTNFFDYKPGRTCSECNHRLDENKIVIGKLKDFMGEEKYNKYINVLNKCTIIDLREKIMYDPDYKMCINSARCQDRAGWINGLIQKEDKRIEKLIKKAITPEMIETKLILNKLNQKFKKNETSKQ